MYTRASFSEDENGYLLNSNGFYLMGWEIGDDGALVNATADVASLTPVSVGFKVRDQADRPADVVLNLDARQSITASTPHFSRSMTVYHSLGQAQQLKLDFTALDPTVETNPSTWSLKITDPSGGTFNNPATDTEIDMKLVFGPDGKIDKDTTSKLPENAGILALTDGDLEIGLSGINWTNNQTRPKASPSTSPA